MGERKGNVFSVCRREWRVEKKTKETKGKYAWRQIDNILLLGEGIKSVLQLSVSEAGRNHLFLLFSLNWSTKKKKKKKKWIFSWKELWDLIYCSFVSFFIPKNEPKSNQKKKTWESKYLAWQLETLKRWKGYWNHRWWWWRIKRKRFKPKKFIL